MENPTTIAIDLSKNVLEIAVEREGRIYRGEGVRRSPERGSWHRLRKNGLRQRPSECASQIPC